MKKRRSDQRPTASNFIRSSFQLLLEGLVDRRRPDAGGGAAEHELHRHRHSHQGRMSLPMTAR